MIKPVTWKRDANAQNSSYSVIHFIDLGVGHTKPLCNLSWVPTDVEVVSPAEFDAKVKELGLCKGCARTVDGRMWLMDNSIRKMRPKDQQLTARVIISNLRQDAHKLMVYMQSSKFTPQQKVLEAERVARNLADKLQEVEWKLDEE